MCTPNSWTCLGRGLRRVLRVFWRGGSARVYKFSADGWGPILLWRPADEVQATQHLALPAVQGDKINGALGRLHLVGTRSVVTLALSSRRSVIFPAQLRQSQKYSGLFGFGELAFGSPSRRKSLPCCK